MEGGVNRISGELMRGWIEPVANRRRVERILLLAESQELATKRKAIALILQAATTTACDPNFSSSRLGSPVPPLRE